MSGHVVLYILGYNSILLCGISLYKAYDANKAWEALNDKFRRTELGLSLNKRVRRSLWAVTFSGALGIITLSVASLKT
jgi:hypothetical protein